MVELQDDSLKHYMTRRAKAVGEAVVNTVLPPQELLELAGDAQSRRLWENVTFLDAPWCEACGFPFEYAVQSGALCGRCSVKRPAYDHARAAMAYDDGSRALILSFKHGGRTEGLLSFAAQMRRAGREILQDADYLMPVPLHPSRLVKRRYNQAALLARALSKMTAARYDPDALQRIKRTDSQGHLNARQRAQNVRQAFKVRPSVRAKIKGAHIVLIDDVLTTGATLESCARTLKRAGAARVDGLCLARVAKAAALPT